MSQQRRQQRGGGRISSPAAMSPGYDASRTTDHRRPRLAQVIPQPLGAGGVAQSLQRLRLDLADALAGDAELLADFLEGVAAAVGETETKLEHARLAGRQRHRTEPGFHPSPRGVMDQGISKP